MDQNNYEELINKDILELMGVTNLPEEKRRELYSKMLDTIQNRVIARVADKLSDQDLEEWKQVTESGDKAKMEEFLKSRNIDIAQLMFQEALLYKTEMAELTKPVRQAAQGQNSNQ